MTDTNLVHELQVVADYLRYKYRYTFADACVKAADKIERLRAIVDKWPKTADGVEIAVGITVNFVLTMRYSKIITDTVVSFEFCGDGVVVHLEVSSWKRPEVLYSTREAAEAAREE